MDSPTSPLESGLSWASLRLNCTNCTGHLQGSKARLSPQAPDGRLYKADLFRVVETTGNAEKVKSRTEFGLGRRRSKVRRSGEPTLMPLA